MLQNRFRSHRPQVKLQATRQHGGGYFLRVGRSQYKFEVLGRLLQRFKHGVKRRVRQHVDLVNHEDLEAPHHWLVHRLFQQLCNLVYPPVGRRIQFGVIDKSSAVNISASFANTTGRSGNVAQAVDANAIKRFGQNA